MPDPSTHVVTGAFGYSGKYIARRLLANKRSNCGWQADPSKKSARSSAVRGIGSTLGGDGIERWAPTDCSI